MKVLIVANYNPGRFSPFVTEQVDSLRRLGVEIDYFGIVGKGSLGYLKNLPKLKRKIKEFRPDLIHAHYGLSGLLASLQKSVPVVVTYHGSDIHSGGGILRLSICAMKRVSHNIFVASHLQKRAGEINSYSVIPCGVNTDIFHPLDKEESRLQLGWESNKHYVLFAGAFDREIKNPELAKAAISSIENCELVELKNYSREEVNLLLNASDCLLMTSHNEGSPQIIKEAMCCNVPIVSVNVGDVKDIIKGCKGCNICDSDVNSLRESMHKVLSSIDRTEGRTRIFNLQLSTEQIAFRILEVYRSILDAQVQS